MSVSKNSLPSERTTEDETSQPKTSDEQENWTFTPNDVVCGRGRKPHLANQEFNLLLNLHASEYASASKTEEPFVVHKVVQAIKNKGGRFLKKQTCGGTYMIMTDVDEIYKKVSEALRHASKPKLPPPTLPSDPNQSTVSVYATAPHATAKSIKSSANVPIILGKSVASRSSSIEPQGASALSTLGQKKRAATSSDINTKPKRKKKESHKGRKIKVPKMSIGKTAETKGGAVAVRPQGVRVAVTKTGKFEARYKPLGEGKKQCPKYIATVNDRETALWLGNFVARSVQNTGTTFEAAKQDAILHLEKLCGGAEGEDQVQAQKGKEKLPIDDLLADVVSTLVKEDEETDNAAAV